MIVEWSEGFSCGIGRIDEENKKLFDIVNELFDSYKLGCDNFEILRATDKLFEYAMNHFSGEERSMMVHRYPEFEEHLAQHTNFKLMIYNLRSDLANGTGPDYYSVFVFLVEWLSEHIGKLDREYFDLILDREYFDYVNSEVALAVA